MRAGHLSTIEAFYQAYKDVFIGNRTRPIVTKDIDIFLATHPAAHAEYFVAFNRPVIAIQAVPMWYFREFFWLLCRY
jgi:hypothetical protein